VRRGSAPMIDLPRFVVVGARIKQATLAKCKSPACEENSDTGGASRVGQIEPDKEQGRQRSMTLTALPAPDIEIGLRHPVNFRMPRESTRKCDPFHNRPKNGLPHLGERLRHAAVSPATSHACGGRSPAVGFGSACCGSRRERMDPDLGRLRRTAAGPRWPR